MTFTLRSLLILVAVVIAVIRPFLIGRELSKHLQKSYEAVAHILVGGLFGAWFAAGDEQALWLALSMSAVEVVCAAATIVGKLKANQ